MALIEKFIAKATESGGFNSLSAAEGDELGQLGKPQVYFRAHHLLTSGDGSYALKWGSTSAYKEDADGKPVYDWTINDKIFDTYLERGIKPYVQIERHRRSGEERFATGEKGRSGCRKDEGGRMEVKDEG